MIKDFRFLSNFRMVEKYEKAGIVEWSKYETVGIEILNGRSMKRSKFRIFEIQNGRKQNLEWSKYDRNKKNAVEI